MASQPVEELEQQETGAEPSAAESQQTPERDWEAEAKELGWKPKGEFSRGDKNWVDAETFVKRGEELLPLVRAENSRMQRRINELEKTIAKVGEFATKSEQRGYERALAELVAKQEAAVESGDLAAFRRIDAEIKDAEAEIAAAKVRFSEEEAAEALVEWQRENPWYASNPALRNYADLVAKKNAEKAANMPPAEFFEFIRETVASRFPEEIEAKTASRARPKPVNPVEAPRGQGAQRGRGWSDLPPEAQRQADQFIRMGALKSRDDYVKNYPW